MRPESENSGSLAADLAVEYVAPGKLTPHASNARTHSKKQIRQLVSSIREFGFVNPVLVDAENRIVAGHGRVEAAKALGLDRIPTVRLEGLSPAQLRAYVIADNRLAELAGWDPEILATELQALTDLHLDFDIEITGFETGDIDVLIQTQDTTASPDPVDEIVEPEEGAPVTKVGDLWLLGRHRLFCEDAREAASFQTLMGGRHAQAVFTDPPYNVPLAGHVQRRESQPVGEFAMAAGEMSEDEYRSFLTTALRHHAAASRDGSVHFVCIDWRHLHAMLRAGAEAYDELINLCVWRKTNGGLGSLYRSQHELICVFRHGCGRIVNNVMLGAHGRNRTNVWDYAGQNVFSRGEALDLHPTVKPVRLVADAILDCSKRDGVILDGFAGSGTTILAAEQTGRMACALELNPSYVDTAIRRWEKQTGELAKLQGTGRTFRDLAEERQSRGSTLSSPDPKNSGLEGAHV